jgi:hypothetical protein
MHTIIILGIAATCAACLVSGYIREQREKKDRYKNDTRNDEILGI